MKFYSWIYPLLVLFILAGFIASIFYNGKTSEKLKSERIKSEVFACQIDSLTSLLLLSDTQYVEVTKVKWLKPKTQIITRTDTVFEPLLEETIYQDSVEDDSITIYYDISTYGYLSELYLGYKPKFFRTITNTIIKDSIVYRDPKAKARYFIGGRVGVSYPSLSPEFQVQFPNKWSFGAGYDVVNNNFEVSALYNIR